ncbi:hypothetical protein SAY86_011401 [Trapa natans]|uniref:Uncharacterized protein n=1 Tax=Trapa natans TaxID=22666 RepID=A0AAN7LWA7_TRANT|nr:hypothetical protein SAY86_011401 [Trapa natans]
MDKGASDGKPEMDSGSRQRVKDEDRVGGDDESEMKSLLPLIKGGMPRKSEKTVRKVRWKDSIGNKLVEVLEFQPSDMSDSENEDEDEDYCICTVM